jgi:hypothetical protein
MAGTRDSVKSNCLRAQIGIFSRFLPAKLFSRERVYVNWGIPVVIVRFLEVLRRKKLRAALRNGHPGIRRLMK